MKIKNAKFIISSPNLAGLEEFQNFEFALLGRSNAGKSTFINVITNNSKLAKTSNTPGKTRLINLFDFDGKFYIADLPGYGWAKVSKAEQKSWQKNLEEYLLNRNLTCLFVFIDAKLGIQNNDEQMINWLLNYNLPFALIVNKTDKINTRDLNKRLKEIEEAIDVPVFTFSSYDKKNNHKIIDFLEEQIKDEK